MGRKEGEQGVLVLYVTCSDSMFSLVKPVGSNDLNHEVEMDVRSFYLVREDENAKWMIQGAELSPAGPFKSNDFRRKTWLIARFRVEI